MEKDFNNNYMPQFNDYGMPPPNIGMDMNELYRDPMFNPVAQYEQAYYSHNKGKSSFTTNIKKWFHISI